MNTPRYTPRLVLAARFRRTGYLVDLTTNSQIEEYQKSFGLTLTLLTILDADVGSRMKFSDSDNGNPTLAAACALKPFDQVLRPIVGTPGTISQCMLAVRDYYDVLPD